MLPPMNVAIAKVELGPKHLTNFRHQNLFWCMCFKVVDSNGIPIRFHKTVSPQPETIKMLNNPIQNTTCNKLNFVYI